MSKNKLKSFFTKYAQKPFNAFFSGWSVVESKKKFSLKFSHHFLFSELCTLATGLQHSWAVSDR